MKLHVVDFDLDADSDNDDGFNQAPTCKPEVRGDHLPSSLNSFGSHNRIM